MKYIIWMPHHNIDIARRTLNALPHEEVHIGQSEKSSDRRTRKDNRCRCGIVQRTTTERTYQKTDENGRLHSRHSVLEE